MYIGCDNAIRADIDVVFTAIAIYFEAEMGVRVDIPKSSAENGGFAVVCCEACVA